MSWSADGQDGNRLKRPIFSSLSLCVLENYGTKSQIMVDSLFEISLDIFLLVFHKHFMYDN